MRYLKKKNIAYAVASVMLISGIQFSVAASSSAEKKQPNIVWISVEDISPHIGAYGDKIARTPHIDKLATQGVRYANAFTTAGVCAPSRSAIITGMYQTSLGTMHMRTSHKGDDLPTPYSAVPPAYVKTFTEYLRAAGYYTTNNVKTDYQFAPIREKRQPLTAWDACSKTAHWRNRPDKSQPFFSVFNFGTTHESRNWATSKAKRVTDPAKVSVPPYYPDTPAVRAELARLYDNIANVDIKVGEILQQLQEDGLAEETIVFFWSDHGDGLPRAKRWLYDSGIHVPLIIRWPGQVEPGSVDDQLISFIDLAPTVLSMAGVQIPRHIQGQAFLGPQAQQPRTFIYAARDRIDGAYDMVRAVRDGRFKYIRNFYPHLPYVSWVPYRNRSETMKELLRLNAADKLEGPQKLWFKKQRFPEELYDLKNDPHEINNLANDPKYTNVLKTMRHEMDDWRIRTRDLGDLTESEMVARMWPGGVQPVTAVPVFIPNTKDNIAAEAVPMGGTFTGATMLKIYCATQGASIAYTTETGEKPYWKLYTGPIRLPVGTTNIRARSIRYGYAESEEKSARFIVEQ